MTEKTSIIEFPCHFPVKIIGNNKGYFLTEIRQLVNKHFPDFPEVELTPRHSAQNSYIAVTVTVYAESQAQLDNFYRDLTQHPDIKMVL
jgi:putative lipoic acid-binding regulatory protein